jgi:hypothetical protein
VIDRDAITRAKLALPLPDLWRKLGWPGEPKRSCRRPYAPEDSRDKGSVFQTDSGAWLFHDFVSGENFDEAALLARVEGIDNGDACLRYIELAGVKGRSRIHTRPMPQAAADSGSLPLKAVAVRPRVKPSIGRLEPFTREDVLRVADLRGLDPMAVQLAAAEGLLWKGQKLGHESWVITDTTRWNAQFRRFDGEPYYLGSINSKVKTLGVKGGWAAWPVGFTAIAELVEQRRFHRVIMVEGMPDMLAGFQVLAETDFAGLATVICMTGSSMLVPDFCLPFFDGLRLRIFADVDEAGKSAAVRWHKQLAAAGAVVDAFDFAGLLRADGQPVKDLNDVMLMDQGERTELGLMEGMQ